MKGFIKIPLESWETDQKTNIWLKAQLAKYRKRLAEAEGLLRETIIQNKRILSAIDKIYIWKDPEEVNIRAMLSEINAQAWALLEAKP